MRITNRWISRFVFGVAGVILLIACIMKILSEWSGNVNYDGRYFGGRLLVPLVAAEATLGLWLCLGLFPRAARLISAAIFAIFAIFSMYQYAIGKSSCGCFGSVSIMPLATAGLDLLIVFAMIIINPPALPKYKNQGWQIVLIILGAVAAGSVAAIAKTSKNNPENVLDPIVHSLGVVIQGQVIESKINIKNISDNKCEISHFQSSCPCLSIHPEFVAIDPGQTVSIDIRIDLAKEPDFYGNLSVEVVAAGRNGERLSRFAIDLSISKK
ncbi:unnamed protein product [Gemmata massiliana]|uniref:Methylamine utilization protein MauE n=1 Tax=Gemmata massiliana TaxID=1210884 RepID=A0A6P2D0W8_9BACT|nr:DUF1573 domain-containing protein [Gemmata massiliana]VTR93100.1 unnamed protein product [Gemmata massiliana]